VSRLVLRGAAVLVTVIGVITSSSRAGATEDTDALAWKPEWVPFRPGEYVFTGIAGAVSAAAYFGFNDPTHPRWTGGILFDNAARDALRLRSPSARDAIRTTSDVTAIASAVLVVGVDSIAIPLARKSDYLALQLTLMDAEAFVVSTLVTTTMFKTIGRARPSYADCQKNPSFDPQCSVSATASFPSGHANAAFTAAGLSCAHHAHLRLYGSPFADAAACGTALTLATATSLFRVMGDRHYMSDVLVSALIGFGVGFGGPTLLHYDVPGRSKEGVATLSPMGGTSAAGFMLSGIF